MFITIITFIILLAVLVFVHEFGHFWVGKRAGMKIEEFGFGFPPRIAGIQKINAKWKWVWGNKNPAADGGTTDPNSTLYSINWIPLGGFVRIVGENNEHENDPRSFINQPFWARFWTLVAGVLMNVLLAFILITVGFVIGSPTAVDSLSSVPAQARFTDPHLMVLEVVPDQPAAKAGVEENDTIVSIDGRQFTNSDDASNYIRSNAGKQFNFVLDRGGQDLDVKVNSLANPGPPGPHRHWLGPFGKSFVSLVLGNLGRPKNNRLSVRGNFCGAVAIIHYASGDREY